MTQGKGKPAVLSVGRLYCDLIFTDLPRLPTLGTEVFAEGFGAHAGGGAFITAAHLSQLGHVSSLAAMLPSSPFADLMRGELEASGIDLSLSAPLPGAAGPQVTVAMAERGDRAFLTRRAGPAFPEISASDLAGREFRHLHVGELASLVEQPAIVDLARSAGMTVSADCSWDDALNAEALRPLVGAVDLFLPNEGEFAALGRMGLADGFAPLTVVKQGARGAVALAPEGRIEAPTVPLEAVDTTGAGDAFNAGFLSRWLAGAPIADCMAAGNARAAMTVKRSGGFTAGEGQRGRIGVAGE